MPTLSELAYRFRPVVAMILVVATVFGAISYFSLPAREDPEITIREAVVTTRYPGLATERMERLVTRTIEEAIRQVPEVEEIRSTTRAGVSIVHVEIDDRHFALDQIWDEVAEAVAEAESDLPDGASEPVLNDDFGDVAVITAALTAEDFSPAEMADMADYVRDRLYAVPGTKRVDVLGVREERVRIETTDARLAEAGIDTEALAATLAAQNVIRPGGEIDADGRAIPIQPTGNFESVETIADTPIRLPGSGDIIALGDIATVTRGYADPPGRLAYYNGEPAIVFAVAMLPGNSVLDHAERVRDALGEIQAALPVGYRLEVVTDQSEQVARAVYGVTGSVLQTLGIVLAVVVLFLGVRTGLIVGAIVPAVMLVTLAVMGFFEMTLERMSLATLVIALGLLVDNGIVVAEDFKRRLEEGASRDEALRRTGAELALPLASSTATTILVFLPLMLAEHVAGEYTRAISIVIAITLTASWVLAMTVTPILCHRFIRLAPEGRGSGGAPPRRDPSRVLFEAMNRGYERVLRRVLRARIAFLAVMIALLAGAIAGLADAPQKFFPDSDRTQLLVYLDLPAGVSSRTTDDAVRAVAARLDDRNRFPHLDGHAAYVGFGGPRFVLSLTPIDPQPNKAFLVLDVGSAEGMDPTIAGSRSMLRQDFPELSARVTRMFLGPSDSTKIEIQVKGPDPDYLLATAGEIEAILRGVPGAIDIRHDWENRIPRLVVAVDQARARRAGVTSADVARSMAAYVSGRPVTEFREGDDIIPVVARGAADERGDLDRLRTLTVHAEGSDAAAPLLQVADFAWRSDFARIAREGLERTVTVEARNTVMTAEDMVPRVAEALDALRADLPPGHSIELDGVVAESAEGRAALAANLPLCLGAMLVLLVAQFNSFRRPAIIVVTIPLVLIGAVIGLYTLGADFGFMPILGLYSLAGIVINNAIVLIDRIDIERRAGAGDEGDEAEAIVTASVRRLRPIVMTTVTTILGLMPLIVSGDALFYGMAAVMAFGLAVGTALTLGVVPVLYSLFLVGRPGGRAPSGVSP